MQKIVAHPASPARMATSVAARILRTFPTFIDA
jgi:hypothetical protein